MVIREMSRDECLRVLAGAKVVRLACAHENQPYVLPVTLAYPGPSASEDCLYGFTTPGQKIEWMRANPLVCVEVDDLANSNQWVSVIAFGRYEELLEEDSPDAQGRTDERLVAHQILQSHAMWWATASAANAARVHRVHRDPASPFVPVFYRVRMNKITGHEATREACDGMASASVQKPSWLRRALQRVYGRKS